MYYACPPGTFAPAGSASCSRCKVGNFSSLAASPSCATCSSALLAGAAVCNVCKKRLILQLQVIEYLSNLIFTALALPYSLCAALSLRKQLEAPARLGCTSLEFTPQRLTVRSFLLVGSLLSILQDFIYQMFQYPARFGRARNIFRFAQHSF